MTRSADRSFALLVLLALISSAILTTLLATLLPRADELFVRGTAGTADVVAVLVLLLAFAGIALGLVALFRQLIETVALIRTLLSQRVTTPRGIDALATDLALGGRVDVVRDRRPFSFCYWFLRPRICLSTGLVQRLDTEELRAVLLHERYHLRHRDPLRLVVARYFAAGLYVVPVVEELVEHYTVQKEIAADQDAVRTLGGVRALASALYKVLPDADEVSLGLLVPVGSLSVTEARIDQLVDGRAVPLVLSRAGIALSGGTLAAATILALSQAGLQATLDPVTPLAALLSFVGPASLLSVAAVTGGVHQLRLVAHR
ncbi:MAG TPA: M56 family metallopeptidase [Candidatus Limnocylindria bacterium]|jgi:beta-lactamase regulating signal transducer with metallopeptidase domain